MKSTATAAPSCRFSGLGIPAAPHILNAVVITAALSAINSDVFGAGRILFGLSRQGHAPAAFGKVSRHGVPWMTVVMMAGILLVGVILNAVIPEDVFVLIASIATFATVWVGHDPGLPCGHEAGHRAYRPAGV